MAKEDFKKLIEENKRQTKLLNTIAGEEGTETAIESLTDTVEQQGKDAKRVAFHLLRDIFEDRPEELDEFQHFVDICKTKKASV